LHVTAGKISVQHSQQACLPWEKSLWLFLTFFFFQEAEDKASIELNSETSWTPNPWKTYLCRDVLNPVTGNVYIEKSSDISSHQPVSKLLT
jgi:hypothetical protein